MPKYRADELHPPPRSFTVELLERAVRADGRRRVDAPVADELGGGRVRWGTELDVRQLDAPGSGARSPATWPSTRPRAPNRPAACCTASPRTQIDALPVREHVRAYLRESVRARRRPRARRSTPRRLRARARVSRPLPDQARRYSTTFKALRQARELHVHEQLLARSRDADATRARRRRRADRELPLRRAGHVTAADAFLAASAAARAREHRRLAREERVMRRSGSIKQSGRVTR